MNPTAPALAALAPANSNPAGAAPAPSGVAPGGTAAVTEVSAETMDLGFLAMLGQLACPAGAPAPRPGGSATREPAQEGEDAAVAAALPAWLPSSLPASDSELLPLPHSAGQVSVQIALDDAPAAPGPQLLADLIRSERTMLEEPERAGAGLLAPGAAEGSPGNRVGAAGAEAVLSRPVHQPVGSAAWADEIGSRLTWMVEQGKHTASVRLSPEHLGPLEIRISMQDDQASVWFGAAHADTRAAIEHALPRLRELFAAQGLTLADTGVFHEPPRQHTPAPVRGALQDVTGERGPSQVDRAQIAGRVQLGLIDAYA